MWIFLLSQWPCVLAIIALCGALWTDFFYFQTVKFNPWNWVLQNVTVARLLKEFPAVYDTDPQIFGKSSSYFQIVGSIRVKLDCFLMYHFSGVMLGTSPVLTHIISEHRSSQYYKIRFNIILPCVPRFLKWSVPIRKWPNPTEAERTDSRTALTLYGRVCVCARACVRVLPPFSAGTLRIVFHYRACVPS